MSSKPSAQGKHNSPQSQRLINKTLKMGICCKNCSDLRPRESNWENCLSKLWKTLLRWSIAQTVILTFSLLFCSTQRLCLMMETRLKYRMKDSWTARGQMLLDVFENLISIFTLIKMLQTCPLTERRRFKNIWWLSLKTNSMQNLWLDLKSW